jgi:hypothetical protein
MAADKDRFTTQMRNATEPSNISTWRNEAPEEMGWIKINEA